MLHEYLKQILLVVLYLILISVEGTDSKKTAPITCPAGYTGPTCSTKIDNCANSPCKHGGTCTSTASGYTCKCATGYKGKHCKRKASTAPTSHCASSPCKNGATCKNKANSYKCKCVAGYTGTQCEKQNDHCANSPCKHGGTCTSTASGYTCKCATGYKGKRCNKKTTTPTNNCASSPCKNGASCKNEANGYKCKCATGYSGAQCDKHSGPTNYCSSSPCLNGGTCTNGAVSFTCSCVAGYNGAQCATTDYCANSPCQNGGTCSNSPSGYTCSCAYGYNDAQCNVAKYLTFNSYGDDNQQVYVDGNLLGSAGTWTQKVTVRFPASSKVIASFVTNAAGSTGGIVGSASTDSGSTAFVTDSSWKCINNQTPAAGWNTANFDDSSWTPATATLKAPEHPDIASAAFWICVGSYWDTRNMYCRKTIPQNIV